jgi:hypothetical protein
VSSTFKLSILMESKKINQLATELAPDLSDLTIIGDPTTGISKKITLSQMASLFTGTVEEYANLAAFPLVGVADTIYIALDTNIIYRYDTSLSAYVILSPNIINSLVFSDANGFDGTITLVGSVATLSITTALTSGSVPFIGASGALTQDNSNLFFDDTNNRLGIATALPTTTLDVFGSGIIGRLNATSTNNSFLGFASNGTNKWSAGNVQSDHRFRIFSEANSAELVSVLQTGEFGIGIANPTTKLHIDGGASALIANLDANVSVAKSVSFRSDNSNRFNIEVSGTESGSNAGADLFIRRYSDAGSLIDTPLTITRSTGNATFSGILITPQVKAATSAGLSINANSGTQVADFGAGGSANITFFGGLSGTSATFSGALSSSSLALTTALSVANGGTGIATLTAGYIPFGNGTSAFESSTSLFWDNTNKRLGINSLTPTNQLHIVGGGGTFTDGLRISRDGTPSQYGILNYTGGGYNSIAVNTTSGEPAFYWLSSTNGTSNTTRMTLNSGTYMLDVTGSGRFTGALTGTSATFSGNVGVSGATNTNGILEVLKASGALAQFSVGWNTSAHTDFFVDVSGNFYIQPQGTTKLTIASTGAATFASSISATSATFSGAGTFTGNSLTVSGNNPQFYLSTTNATLYNFISFTAGTAGASIFLLGNTYATTGPYIASGMTLTSGAGGVNLNVETATGAIGFYTGTSTLRMTIAANGAVNVVGSLSKGSGSFRIDHPLESMTETHQLVHSFIEGPKADLIYRGKLNLINGKGQSNIDEVSTMTDGTFELLCRDVQCFTTNESGWDLVKGKVIANIIYIESQNTNSTDEISWMVIGERKDKHMMDTEWTDENGKVIVEPLKPIIEKEKIIEGEIISPIKL